MFVRASRVSFAKEDDAPIQLYNEKIKPMWSSQPGFHSIQRFEIVDGPHKGQEMNVLRFDNQDSFDKATKALAEQREALKKDLDAAGVKIEETLLLNEVS